MTHRFFDQIGFEKIVLKLIHLSDAIVSKLKRSMVPNSIMLLCLIILSQENLVAFIKNIYEESKLDEFLIKGILDCNTIYIRLTFSRTFKNLSESLLILNETEFSKKLLNVMLSQLSNMTPLQKSQSKYFFQLLENLLDAIIKKDTLNDDLNKLCEEILETLSESGLEEELLTGYLKLLNIIIQAKQDIKTNLGEKIIDLIIYKHMIKDIEEYKANKNIPDSYNILMYAESDSEFKEMLTKKNFYNQESKSTIFSIILNLVTDNRTNLEKLLNTGFTSLTDYTSKANVKQGYNPTSERRGSECYIGLRNPSCMILCKP
jgi:hypothetical protein